MVKFLVLLKFKMTIFGLSLEIPKYSPDAPTQKLKQQIMVVFYLDEIVILLVQQWLETNFGHQLMFQTEVDQSTSCTNQQPPQRGGAVPGLVWVGSKWLLAFPRVPVTPGTPHLFFRYAAP